MMHVFASVEPWWSEGAGAWIAAIAGSGLGIFAGLLGGALGFFAPRGRFKRQLLTPFFILAALGPVVLVSGAYANLSGQPYGVHYPLMLIGAIMCSVFASAWSAPVMAYRLAELRGPQPAGPGLGHSPASAAPVLVECWAPGAPIAVWSWRIAFVLLAAGLAGLAFAVSQLNNPDGFRGWFPWLMVGSALLMGAAVSATTTLRMSRLARAAAGAAEQHRLAAGEFRRA